MYRLLILIAFAGVALVSTPSTAQAHAGYHPGYDRAYAYHGASRRAHKMPRWLKRDRKFRNWYRHSSLRHRKNPDWHAVYHIFLFEQHHAARTWQRRHGHYSRPGTRWYPYHFSYRHDHH